jgi:hypothetical protein
MTDRRQVEHRSIQNKELMCQNTTAIEKGGFVMRLGNYLTNGIKPTTLVYICLPSEIWYVYCEV